ncbi:MAG: DNA helicase II [Clostridiales bacterium]|nr:DNA helicase II [Clostridiales bacterium]
MSRRVQRVHYQLSNVDDVMKPSQEDMKNILRAADEIIATAGRAMLAKILKGSKDKRVLEFKHDECPSYGYYNSLTIPEITKIVDWMIINDYLDIDYNYRLPMIVFSYKGWELYKPVYADELYNKILMVASNSETDLINQLLITNREVVKILLLQIGASKNIGAIGFLENWKENEVKKVRKMINGAINAIKN